MFSDEQDIIPQVKLNINRIFIPIETNLLSSKNIKNQNDNIETIDNFKKVTQSFNNQKLLPKQDIKFLSQQQMESPIVSIPSTQQLMNPLHHPKSKEIAFYHEQYLPSSFILAEEQQVSIDFIDEHPPSSSDIPIEQFFSSTNKADTLSSVIRVERPLSPPLSQFIPHSIINDKQATNRIFNEKNSTLRLHPSKLVTLTPISSSSSKKTSESINNDDDKSSNHVRYYQIGSIFTSTSSLIMHQNEVIAHATASDPFLSDTIFIIIIATLTIIILLFCFGLFCLCRRTTQRNISPSFDGGSYAGLNGHSFEIPIGSGSDYQQRISKYENNTPYVSSSSSIQPKPSINHPQVLNDRILLPQTVALHHTAKQKVQMSKNKLKKKRVGFCCCNNSKQTPSTIVNTRTQINKNEM